MCSKLCTFQCQCERRQNLFQMIIHTYIVMHVTNNNSTKSIQHNANIYEFVWFASRVVPLNKAYIQHCFYWNSVFLFVCLSFGFSTCGAYVHADKHRAPRLQCECVAEVMVLVDYYSISCRVQSTHTHTPLNHFHFHTYVFVESLSLYIYPSYVMGGNLHFLKYK